MAYISETTQSISTTLTTMLHSLGTTISTFVGDIYNAGSRADMIKELQAMDDATLLSKHRIKRGQIVAYVFRDKMVP
jgi:hypothetical protein